MTDAVIAEWKERIRAAAASKGALRIRGGGSKDFYGQTLAGDVLETSAYTGIIDYDATELVITARAGTPLTEIEATYLVPAGSPIKSVSEVDRPGIRIVSPAKSAYDLYLSRTIKQASGNGMCGPAGARKRVASRAPVNGRRR